MYAEWLVIHASYPLNLIKRSANINFQLPCQFDIAFYSIRINQFGFIFIPHLLKLVSYSHLRKGLAYNFIRTNKSTLTRNPVN